MSSDKVNYTGDYKVTPPPDVRWICQNQKCRCRNAVDSVRCLACGRLRPDAQA